MPILPDHFGIGRGGFGGPVAGAYFEASFVVASVPHTQASPYVPCGFVAPMDFRVVQAQSLVRDLGDSATATAQLYKNTSGTFVPGDADSVHMLGTTAVADTFNLKQANEVAGNNSGDAVVLIKERRDVNRGDAVFFDCVTTGGTSNTLEDVCFVIVGFTRGHVNLDPNDD